jgi:pyruvate formate lyase activating enzyme
MIKDASLWSALAEGKVSCALCAHRCAISPGKLGVCGVRENRDGKLMTHVYGEVIAAHVDPIEKKPFFHFLPGSTSLSIATAGCNFRCSFCQNWQISQASKGPGRDIAGEKLSPEEIVSAAKRNGCRSISYTYTEPTIFFEYALDAARLARAAGLYNNFVTNGYMTAEALEAFHPNLDAANVDLKAFKDETYRKICGARLEPVLETIKLMRKLDIWVEVTTLVVPGLNDSAEELRDIARFLAGVDRDLPWHISRFHPDFNYLEARPTPVETLRKALAIGTAEGLNYVYVGNVTGEGEDTVCPKCGKVLIRRRGFSVVRNEITAGRCPSCLRPVPGRYS